MSIFPKKKINVGDLVIGIKKYGWDSKIPTDLKRDFEEPSMVLEIKEDSALVFFEQHGPRWYNLSNLERVYVTEEFTSIDGQDLATDKLNNSHQSRNQDDSGNW